MERRTPTGASSNRQGSPDIGSDAQLNAGKQKGAYSPQPVTIRQPLVWLDEVVREHWEHVATTEATLVVTEDGEFASALVSAAESVAEPVSLEDSAVADDHREQYACAPAIESPQIETGTTLAGSDRWHGQRLATEAESLVDAYNAGTCATTECDGFGVAVACDRFGMLDRYFSVRAASKICIVSDELSQTRLPPTGSTGRTDHPVPR